MSTQALTQRVIDALEDRKGRDITVLDVRDKTTITDVMIIATATSNRHSRALADAVVEKAKTAGYRPVGVEGETSGEWVLVDLLDVVVHIMQPRIRAFYNLEKLWSVDEARVSSASDD